MVDSTHSGVSGVHIFKNDTAVLIVGSEVQATYHRHHALQVSIALDRPFHLRWETDSDASNGADFNGVIIRPDQKHSLDGKGGKQALLLIDPEHTCAEQLTNKWLGEKVVAPFPVTLPALLMEKLTKDLSAEFHESDPVTTLLDALLPGATGLAPMDNRVRSALNYLQSLSNKNISAGELSNEVHLSESRLAHLFKQQVGIPVRRYLMWLRLMDAIECAFAGKSLTDAAAHAGFSDSAHFSRTFQAMFGIQPSLVIQHSQFIQVP
ncbi:MAG: AraC family transcriptional regulator [Pseudomonadota bacterium]